MPMPPVSQWSTRQTPSAAHEKLDGTNASRAPRCRAPIQSKEGQAMGEALNQDLVVVMRGLGPVNLAIGLSGSFRKTLLAVNEIKKADVVEAPRVFNHVGLLVNEPPGQAEL